MNVKRAIFNIFDVICKIVLTVIAVMFIIRGIRFAYDIGLQIFDQQPVSAVDTSTVSVVIPEGASAAEVGRILQDQGLIRDARLFRVQERLSVYHEMIASGTFALSPSMTADEMIAIMAAPTVEAKRNEEAAEAAFNEATAAAGQTDETGEMPAEEEDDTPGMALPDEEEAQTPEPVLPEEGEGEPLSTEEAGQP